LLAQRSTPRELEQAEKERLKLRAELSLHEFLKQAWLWIEGNTPFTDGWHLQAICEHLEAVANRQIKNLLINMPPRCSKSTLVSIAFPAWRWLHNPSERFLYASYSFGLASRDSQKCRALIQSPWYQGNWARRFQLSKDQNTKKRFDNTATGYRIATSSGSGTTGEGGSILITDDPNNAADVESEVQRQNRLDWWNTIWSTRLNDRSNDCRIVVQQRIHESDISGYILANDELKEWTKLILPMEYEEKRKSKTIILPSTNGKIWEDPRTKERQLLWPEKFDAKALEGLKNDLGSEYRIAGQLQQRPSPADGGILKRDWFCWWKERELPKIEFILQSWDTALKGDELSAYSACTTWGVFYDHNYIENVILLSMWKAREEYPEVRERIKRMYYDYRDTGTIKPHGKCRPVDMCLMEAKASGEPYIADLNRSGIRLIPFIPTTKKTARARNVSPLIEGGRVWLPARAPNYERLLPFADEFLEAAVKFPTGESNDVIDTMSQALMKLRDGHFLLNPKDERPIPPPTKQDVRIY
jgi:predicted phage terminase large subunit-like protein